MSIWKKFFVIALLLISANINAATVISLSGDIDHMLYKVYLDRFSKPGNLINDENSIITYEMNGVLTSYAGSPDMIPSEIIRITGELNGMSGVDLILEFDTPDYEVFNVGLYDEINSRPFGTSPLAGMWFSIGSNSYSTIAGNFSILELDISNELNQYGYPIKVINNLALDFIHICPQCTSELISEGYIDENFFWVEPVYRQIDATMYGSIRINSGIPISAVPIPAAAWLFGSGLISLVGAARRKKINYTNIV